MGLIKGILCKVDHFIVNMIGRHFINTVCNTALYSLGFISVNEILTLFFHHSSLFLTHGTAHQVASSHGISGQVADDLHYLLLVYNTPVSRAQNRLQLRAFIGNGAFIILSF